MNQRELSQWRTVLFLMFLSALELAAVQLLKDSGETGAKMLSEVTWAFVGLAFVQGGKSLGQHLGKGGGVKGAVTALLTDAKPEGKP